MRNSSPFGLFPAVRRRSTGARASWAAIRTLRNHLHIPVFANGGVACRADADRCMAETGVNGVMVGEALLENPALFTKARTLRTGTR